MNEEKAMSYFKTLITEENIKSRWYPISIYHLKANLSIDWSQPNAYALCSNIAYSLQYIQYLELQFKELNLSSVIYTMLCKSYVITGMSILEGLFSNYLKSIGKWKTIEWEEVATFKSNPVSTNGTEQKIHTVVYNKIPEKLDRMDLEAMIQKLDRIRTLPVDHLVYPALKRLKQLRNRVHLQMNTDDYDHDYNCFSYKERDEMRSILWQILTIPVFCKNPSVYDFIKPEQEVSPEESGD